MINIENDLTISNTLEIFQWLSLHYNEIVSSDLWPIIEKLFGRTKDEKKKNYRGIKRVLKWENDWADLTTSAENQLKSPLTGKILLDKKFRNRGMSYILDYTVQDSVDNTHSTAADILLAQYIQFWIKGHFCDLNYILQTIPSLAIYMKNVHQELSEIFLQMKSYYIKLKIHDSFLYFIDNYFKTSEWIDELCITKISNNVFNFTHYSKNCSKSSIDKEHELRTSSLYEPSAFELQRLLGLVIWDGEYQPLNADVDVDVDVDNTKTDYSAMETLSELFWSDLQLPNGREQRKRQQICSLLPCALRLSKQGARVVEFCSGGGYVGIAFAALRPDVSVVLTDMNPVSLAFAKQRILKIGLSNVQCLRADLADLEAILIDGVGSSNSEMEPFLSGFDVGIGLHCCGSATDRVLRLCVERRAAFVISPCCYGFLRHGHSSDGPAYPQSEICRSAGCSSDWMARLSSAADQTFWGHDQRSSVRDGCSAGRLAMRLIDTDRVLYAREGDYECVACTMDPLASLKNHVLTGRPKS